MSVLDQNIAIFKYFEEISKIPHGSFHEEKNCRLCRKLCEGT